MAKTAPNKNKPRFFSVLITLILIVAGIFGVYKVRSMLHPEAPFAFFPEKESVTEKNAPAAQTTAKPADENAVAAAKAIGEADSSLTPAFLSYIADNCDAKALKTVQAAMSAPDFNREVWFTATGKSFHTLNALADGSVDKGLVRDLQSDKDTIEIGFAGKINAAQIGNTADSVSADLQKVMKDMDIQVVNSECVFSADGTTGEYIAESKTAELYKQIGVDIASVANNHIADNGADGITQTLKTLEAVDVSHVGAGADVNEAAKPAYFLAGGRKIAFIAASDTLGWRSAGAATAASAGVLSLRYNLDAVKNAVKAAKEVSDYVFVYIHAGVDENASWFDIDQDTWSKALIDEGADGVIGARSSRLQGMEFYNGKLIVYGLGNFLYDGYARETGVYKLTIDKDGTMTHTFLPCAQADGKVSLCTSDADKYSAFSRIATYCGNVVSVDSDGTIRNNRR